MPGSDCSVEFGQQGARRSGEDGEMFTAGFFGTVAIFPAELADCDGLFAPALKGKMQMYETSYCSMPASSRDRSSEAFCATVIRSLGERVSGEGTPEVISMIFPGFFLSVK